MKKKRQIQKRQKKALYGVASNFFIDLAKYVTTGVIITTLLNDLGETTIVVYSIGLIAIGIFLGLGFWLVKMKEE